MMCDAAVSVLSTPAVQMTLEISIQGHSNCTTMVAEPLGMHPNATFNHQLTVVPNQVILISDK